jgi:predicted chitinase
MKIVKGLRKLEGYKSMKLFTAINCELPESDKSYKKITEQLNKTFEKYEINSCLRKIHFFAQSYHETDRFRTLLEYSTEGSYKPYFGRGFMQLTHKIGYKMYTAYYNDISGKDDDFVNDYSLIASDLFFAFDSAGWFWKRGKKFKTGKTWSAPVNAPKYVKKYKAKYPKKTYKYKYKEEPEQKYGAVDLNLIADNDHIDIISYLVNGGGNGLNERRKYLKQLKISMNYDRCKSK